MAGIEDFLQSRRNVNKSLLKLGVTTLGISTLFSLTTEQTNNASHFIPIERFLTDLPHCAKSIGKPVITVGWVLTQYTISSSHNGRNAFDLWTWQWRPVSENNVTVTAAIFPDAFAAAGSRWENKGMNFSERPYVSATETTTIQSLPTLEELFDPQPTNTKISPLDDTVQLMVVGGNLTQDPYTGIFSIHVNRNLTQVH